MTRVDRDELLARVDLIALADQLLGPHRGPPRSPVWPCPNPNHAQTGRTPPVTVFVGDRGIQRWHCHGCGAGGTAIDLVAAVRRSGIGDAIRHLGDTTHTSMRPPPRPPRASPMEPAELRKYVEGCAARLWTPAGRGVLSWLTQHRRLPPSALKANGVGADLGPRHDPRPAGIPKVGPAAVFPIRSGIDAQYVQLRVVNPWPGGPRYLSPNSSVLPNPRVGVYWPAPRASVGGVVVCEGPVDALTAAGAGAVAVAVLGASACGPTVARKIGSVSRGPVLLAFDADDAGNAATERLAALLADTGVPVGRLELPSGATDLNDWWMREPAAVVDSLRSHLPPVRTLRGPSLSIG
jgi:DNA primase